MKLVSEPLDDVYILQSVTSREAIKMQKKRTAVEKHGKLVSSNGSVVQTVEANERTSQHLLQQFIGVRPSRRHASMSKATVKKESTNSTSTQGACMKDKSIIHNHTIDYAKCVRDASYHDANVRVIISSRDADKTTDGVNTEDHMKSACLALRPPRQQKGTGEGFRKLIGMKPSKCGFAGVNMAAKSLSVSSASTEQAKGRLDPLACIGGTAPSVPIGAQVEKINDLTVIITESPVADALDKSSADDVTVKVENSASGTQSNTKKKSQQIAKAAGQRKRRGRQQKDNENIACCAGQGILW